MVIEQNTFGKGLHVGIGSAAADAAADTVVALVNCLVREITAEIVDFPFADFDVGKVGITCLFGDYVVELGGNGGLPQGLAYGIDLCAFAISVGSIV